MNNSVLELIILVILFDSSLFSSVASCFLPIWKQNIIGKGKLNIISKTEYDIFLSLFHLNKCEFNFSIVGEL